MRNHFRPVYEERTYNIIIEVRDFSLDKATPQCAAATDAHIDRDDASDDFIKEKPHANAFESRLKANGPGGLRPGSQITTANGHAESATGAARRGRPRERHL
jgi:hypothetical protein